MDIIEYALSYFEDNKVPPLTTFNEEVMRPNQLAKPSERKVLDFLYNYTYCHEKISQLRFSGGMFQMRYEFLLKDTEDVNANLSRPFDIGKLKIMLDEAKVELKALNESRIAARRLVVEDYVVAAEDKIIALNARREHIAAMMTELVNDTKTLSDEMGDEHISLSINDGILVIDKAPNPYWDEPHYSYHSTGEKLRKLKIEDNDCDCCDCCNCQ